MFNKSYSDRPSFGGRGGKKFGGPRFGGGRGFGGDRPAGRSFSEGRDEQGGGLHDATCAKCNAHCQVPFRPNGRKPVYCSNCFVRDEQSAPRFERGGYDKPSYGEKRPYVSTPRNNSAELETQLKAVNAKLDQIIAALNS